MLSFDANVIMSSMQLYLKRLRQIARATYRCYEYHVTELVFSWMRTIEVKMSAMLSV